MDEAKRFMEECLNNGCAINVVNSRIKISILTDISVLRFYGYIGYIGDISMDIFT